MARSSLIYAGLLVALVNLSACDNVKRIFGSDTNTGSVSGTADAPTALTATTITSSSIQIQWTNNSTSAYMHSVQMCAGTNCSNFTDVADSPVAPSATTHTETGLTPNTVYRFRVRTTSPQGHSEYVTSSDITTLLLPNTSLSIDSITTNSIEFSWVVNDPDQTGIQVQRCNGAGCTNFADTFSSPLAAGTNTYTESGLSQSSVYRFRVRANTSTGYSEWLTTSDITTLPSLSPIAAASCAAPQTRIIDKGTKGSTVGVQRGLWSDTKIIPGTQRPATVYYDGSATGGSATIKASYWDGSKFNVEHVAADTFVAAGSATWVKLAFLTVGANAGRPVVVWTTGATTVKAAMRSAAFGTSGYWSAAVIDTVPSATTRAASISVSPADHISVVYTTTATSAGRVRFLYCDAPCTSLAGFIAMSATSDNIENTNQAANIAGLGTAWCKFDATTYYPAVVYHGNNAANTRYAVCANSNLSSCRTSAGWTVSSVVAGAAPVHMSLVIDSTVTQDNVRVLLKPATATAMNTYTSASGCNAPGAFTAGVAIGAATTGTTWARLLRDSGGLYHVIANDGTTVVYSNSVTSNLQTTTWNAATALETVTLPAVGAGAGGADLATGSGMIFASYGLNTTPFNLNMGIVNDISIPSNNAAAVYYSVLPDTGGHIDVPLLAGNKTRNVSVASTSSGQPAVAYVDHSAGTLAAGRLKFALRSGTTADSAWTIATLPNAVNPLFPSLAFDHDDMPWISFYDSNNFRYYLATNTATDGSGTWIFYQAPLGAKTASGTAPATDDTAIAMYYSGGVAQPVLIFMNSTAAGGAGVKAIRLNPTTGQFGTLVTIDTMGASFGTRLSADFDTSGNIVIAYYDITTTSVKFNYSTNGGTTWRPASIQISTALFGREGASIKINPATSRPAISYYRLSTNNVYLAECTSALTSCHLGANWTTTNVQSTTAVGVSGVTVTSHEQMLNTSLSFSAAGVPYVAYATGVAPSGVNPGLVLTDATTGYTPTLPVELATTAASTYLSGASAVSMSQYGLNVGSVRNSLGQFIAVHVGPNNWLYATSCGD